MNDVEYQLFKDAPEFRSGDEIYAVALLGGAPEFPLDDLPILEMDDDWQYPAPVTNRIVVCSGRYKEGWAWISLSTEVKEYVGSALESWIDSGDYELGEWCFLLQRPAPSVPRNTGETET